MWYIAESLRQIGKLRHLVLDGVGLDDEGLVQLAESLKVNDSLSMLVRSFRIFLAFGCHLIIDRGWFAFIFFPLRRMRSIGHVC